MFSAPRQAVDRLHSRIPDPALGQVDDPLIGEIVVRAYDRAEIGDGITDFLALVKAQTDNHPVGQADGDEPFLELAGLEPGAHQDRHIVERMPRRPETLDLIRDDARLLLAIPDTLDDDRVALLAFGPESFAEPAVILRDETRGGAQNMGGGAVILFEPHDARAGKIVLEAKDVADFGATPPVDGLVVIPHAADVLMGSGQKPKPEVLGHVGVLVFVHENVAEQLLVALQNVTVFGEKGETVQQQIAEIDGIERFQAVLVLAVQLEGAAHREIAQIGRRHPVWREALVLPALDDGAEPPGRPALLVNIGRLESVVSGRRV